MRRPRGAGRTRVGSGRGRRAACSSRSALRELGCRVVRPLLMCCILHVDTVLYPRIALEREVLCCEHACHSVVNDLQP